MIHICKLKAKQIHITLSNTFKINTSYSTIIKVLDNIRQTFANYMKNKYRNLQIGGAPDIDKPIALDETLILHINRQQEWLVDY